MPKVIVKLIKCENLLKKKLGFLDPFVELECESSGKIITKTSSTQKRTHNPIYNESFVFYTADLGRYELLVRVIDKERLRKDECLGTVDVNFDAFERDKWQLRKFELFDGEKKYEHKKRASVTLRILATTNSCKHALKLNCEVQPKCCPGKWYGCRKCHNRKNSHEMKEAKSIRCLNCLVEQPVEKTCIGCDLELAPEVCTRCRIMHDGKEDPKELMSRHCFDCKECILENVAQHKCFLFTCTKSRIYEHFQVFKGHVRNKKNRKMFKKLRALFQSCCWIIYFFEAELVNSCLRQMQQTINVVNKASVDPESKHAAEFKEFNTEVLVITNSIFVLQTMMKEDIPLNKTARRRIIHLAKGRILRKISFMFAIKMDFEFVPDPLLSLSPGLANLKSKDPTLLEEKPAEKEDETSEDETEGEPEEDSSYDDEHLNSIMCTIRSLGRSINRENQDDYLGLRITKVLDGERFNHIYDYINERSFDMLRSDENTMKTIAKYANNPDEGDEDTFFLSNNVVVYHYLVGKMLKTLYGNVQFLQKISEAVKKKIKISAEMDYEDAKKFIHEQSFVKQYMKVFHLDEWLSMYVVIDVLMGSFQNDDLFLTLVVSKLNALVDIIKGNFEERKGMHHRGMKELLTRSLDHMSQAIVNCINQSFWNYKIIFRILNLFHNVYNLVFVKSVKKALTPHDYVHMVMKKPNYFHWITKKLSEERAVLYDKSKKNDPVYDCMVVFRSILDHLKKIEEKGLEEFFKKRYQVDLTKTLSETMKRNVAKKIVETSKVARINPEKIPIEFYKQLIPTIFDVCKFVKCLDEKIVMYDLFHQPISISMGTNLFNKLAKWIDRSIKLEKFETISKDIKHSKYCNNVVELVFQPINLIFEVDCISRETEGDQQSIMLEYFVIMDKLLQQYSLDMKHKIEMEIDKVFGHHGGSSKQEIQKKNGGLLLFHKDILKALNPDTTFSEKVKKVDLKSIAMFINNIHGCFKQTNHLLLDADFEEILINCGCLEMGEEDFGEDQEGSFTEDMGSILDIPQVRSILDNLTSIRDDATKIVAECVYLTMFDKLAKLLTSKEGKGFSIGEACNAFCDSLSDEIMKMGSLLYTRVLKMMIRQLFTIFLDETLDYIFQKKVLHGKSSSNIKNNSFVLVSTLTNFFHAGGSGLPLSFLNESKAEFEEIVSLLDLTSSALLQQYEAQPTGHLAMYYLKLLKIKGSRKEKKIAQKVLPNIEDEASKKNRKRVSEDCVLFVTLVSADGLPKMDRNGLADPYTIMRLSKQKSRSKTIKETLEPKWNENFVFKVKQVEREILKIAVWDYDFMSSDDFIGEAKIALDELAYGKKELKTMKIVNKGECNGTITLEVKLSDE